MISRAKAGGHDMAILRNTHDGGPMDNIFVSLDPSRIRSQFAKFDPEDVNLKDILSGVGGAGVLGSVAAPREAVAEALRSKSQDVGTIKAPRPGSEKMLKYVVDPVRKLAKNPLGSLIAPTGIADALEKTAYGDELSTEDYVKAILDTL
jgi:hypothetical protein